MPVLKREGYDVYTSPLDTRFANNTLWSLGNFYNGQTIHFSRTSTSNIVWGTTYKVHMVWRMISGGGYHQLVHRSAGGVDTYFPLPYEGLGNAVANAWRTTKYDIVIDHTSPGVINITGLYKTGPFSFSGATDPIPSIPLNVTVNVPVEDGRLNIYVGNGGWWELYIVDDLEDQGPLMGSYVKAARPDSTYITNAPISG